MSIGETLADGLGNHDAARVAVAIGQLQDDQGGAEALCLLGNLDGNLPAGGRLMLIEAICKLHEPGQLIRIGSPAAFLHPGGQRFEHLAELLGEQPPHHRHGAIVGDCGIMTRRNHGSGHIREQVVGDQVCGGRWIAGVAHKQD